MVTHFKKSQQSKKVTTRFTVIAIAGALAIACLLLIIEDVGVYKKQKQLYDQIKELDNKIDQTKKDNNQLGQSISAQQNDQYVEQVAREELGMQKAGETAVSFVAQTPVADVSVDSKSPAPWWQNFITWLKSKF